MLSYLPTIACYRVNTVEAQPDDSVITASMSEIKGERKNVNKRAVVPMKRPSTSTTRARTTSTFPQGLGDGENWLAGGTWSMLSRNVFELDSAHRVCFI